MLFCTVAAFLTAFATAPKAVDASSAGANVHACVYSSTTPLNQETVSFTVKAVQCMNSIGSDQNVNVIKAGTTCVNLGYVEGKGSDTGGDNCVVNDSIWSLAYSNSATGESGSTEATLTFHVFSSNTFELKSQSKGTYACDQAQLCKSTTYSWGGGAGDVYVIFDPSASTVQVVSGGQESTEQALIDMTAEEL